MSRKDYKAFAEIIRNHVDAAMWTEARAATLRSVAQDMADVFKADNAAFDRARFINACFPPAASTVKPAPAWARKVSVKLRSSMDVVKG
jgi:uncharacterized protein (DUF4415 family)